MIVNLRGCSGAGKSYPGFRLLQEHGPGEKVFSREYFTRKKCRNCQGKNAKVEQADCEKCGGEGIIDRPKKKDKLIAHVLPGGLCLAGRYEMGKSTINGIETGYSGGLDGWYPMDELQRLLSDLAGAYPHMYFESLMISGTYERWLNFSIDHGGPENFVFATLDTPLELCLERVQQRNGGVPVKEDQIDRHRKQVLRAANKFWEAGANSVRIDHTRSYEQVKEILVGGGWTP